MKWEAKYEDGRNSRTLSRIYEHDEKRKRRTRYICTYDRIICLPE